MIKRRVYDEIFRHLASDQMTVIIGPRQVGKTYLMGVLREKLEKEGKKTVWLNLDKEEDKPKIASQASLVSYINLVGGKEKVFVFIDEIQRKRNAGLFLKGIFDMNLPHKFIISGSGSMELKAKIPESMAGRKQMFMVNPVGFFEFVNFKTDYRFEDRLKDYFVLEKEQVLRLLSEYMLYGGYPRVVLSESIDSKQKEMQEIYQSYIDRDLNALLNLEKTDEFSNLLKIMASQIGALVNVNELSSTLGVDQKTIKRFLWYLEQTFILKKVTPYYRNIRSEITKAPVYYFYDTGLRNWILGLFGLPEIPTPLAGHLFENVIFNMLSQEIKSSPTEIHFWRTKDGAEVDFVLEKGLEVTPVEAKFTKLKSSEVPRSYRSFVGKYKPKAGFVVHLGERSAVKVNHMKVSSIPFWELLEKKF